MTDASKSVLVVGSWAKEQITLEHLKKTRHIKVFSYLDTNNPGIIALADGHRIGSLGDVVDIVGYAKSLAVDLVLITTAEPLSKGVVDGLIANGIACFGPTQQSAKLETNKAFARNLLQKYYPKVIPEFGIFSQAQQALDFARQLSWEVAVKPLGLTDGLGVKVAGDQLHTECAIEDYINHILTQQSTENHSVIIEKKVSGEEFTLQCLVNGPTLIPMPLVQDFKKLLNHDKGPNTASMGSYSDANFLLPFVTDDIYKKALDVMQKTLQGLEEETNQQCQGFLYGQFMLCEDGLKLIEYNFRPGDPEWMNTLYILKDNLLDILQALMYEESAPIPTFEKQATVCRYIVPANYPHQLNQTLEATLDEAAIRENDVDFYFSCGMEKEGFYPVGSERGIAFIAKDDTILAASERVEKAITSVKGNYHFRSDIISDEMLRSKTKEQYVDNLSR